MHYTYTFSLGITKIFDRVIGLTATIVVCVEPRVGWGLGTGGRVLAGERLQLSIIHIVKLPAGQMRSVRLTCGFQFVVAHSRLAAAEYKTCQMINEKFLGQT